MSDQRPEPEGQSRQHPADMDQPAEGGEVPDAGQGAEHAPPGGGVGEADDEAGDR